MIEHSHDPYQLVFRTKESIGKPVTVRKTEHSCPFCKVDELTDILETDGSIIWLMNKFPTLANTFQTVLIETDECEGELSTYSKPHLHRLFRFAIRNWLETAKRPEFKSTILFKNHGPLSGGTVRHPHMQIVGIENLDYMEDVKREWFDGIPIYESETVTYNLSTMPKMGFYELNVLLRDLEAVDEMADCVQAAADFIMHHFKFRCDSYNLFFYQLEDAIACKIFPRYITTPIYIGYSIAQVPDDMDMMVGRAKEAYEALHAE